MTNDSVDVRDMLTVQEVASFTGYTDAYIRQLILAGEVEAVKRGRQWFVSRPEAERLKHQRKDH